MEFEHLETAIDEDAEVELPAILRVAHVRVGLLAEGRRVVGVRGGGRGVRVAGRRRGRRRGRRLGRRRQRRFRRDLLKTHQQPLQTTKTATYVSKSCVYGPKQREPAPGYTVKVVGLHAPDHSTTQSHFLRVFDFQSDGFGVVVADPLAAFVHVRNLLVFLPDDRPAGASLELDDLRKVTSSLLVLEVLHVLLRCIPSFLLPSCTVRLLRGNTPGIPIRCC